MNRHFVSYDTLEQKYYILFVVDAHNKDPNNPIIVETWECTYKRPYKRPGLKGRHALVMVSNGDPNRFPQQTYEFFMAHGLGLYEANDAFVKRLAN